MNKKQTHAALQEAAKSGDAVAGMVLADFLEENSMEVFEIGKCYLLRCIPFIYVGKLARIACCQTGKWLVLEGNEKGKAAWIPDSGRWNETLALGAASFNEIETYPGQVLIPVDKIVDCSMWAHPLPIESK